ncbi:MAG: response regulator [Treponema sp.]|nr:response regulator [Treponema sp.]
MIDIYDKHLAEVEGVNFRVYKALTLTSMLISLLLGFATFIPGSYISTKDFRILFLSSALIFAAAYLPSLWKSRFLLHHSTTVLYVNIFICQIFFLLLDRSIAYHRGNEVPYSILLGFLMIQPIIITDKQPRLVSWTVFSALEFMVLSVILKPLHIAMNDIINCMVMSVMGVIIGGVSKTYFINYTEMKVREKDIEIRSAEAASKAKTEFLALISHEVRTPLNAVTNMNEMILRESGDETALGYSRAIKIACKTLSSLINDILDFSKLNSGEFSLLPIEYNLDEMLNEMLSMVIPRVQEKGLEFKLDVQADIPNNLMGDDLRIKQCLMNLLSNAIKYTDSGSVSLSVSYCKAEEDDDQSIFLTFKVSDTGIGIKESDIGRIAYPFERLDEMKNRSIEGTGLGLAIVHGILSKMGSSLHVKSEYGKGSEFSFTIWQPVSINIPIGNYVASPPSSEEKAARYGTFTAAGARILIVDDLQMNLDVICSLLKCTGLQIDTALSGKKAIEMVRQNHYDVVFIDHRMPVMDGIETLHAIKQLEIAGVESTKFIMLTANAAKDSRSLYLREGFHDYLSKPVDPQELEEMLVCHLPKSLVRLSAGRKNEAAGTQDADDAFLQKYSLIEGASVEDAMKYCRSVDSLKKAIQSFCENVAGNTEDLLQGTAKSDYKNCGLIYHSLKTELRLLGFTLLSKTAAQLEEYADSEYAEGLRILAPDFTEQVMLCARQLEGLTDKKQAMTDAVLEDAVRSLEECAQAGDFRSASRVLDMLEEYEVPKELREIIGQIRQAVRNQNVDFFRDLVQDVTEIKGNAD